MWIKENRKSQTVVRRVKAPFVIGEQQCDLLLLHLHYQMQEIKATEKKKESSLTAFESLRGNP